MKTITLYQATDGSNWPTEAEALKRDQLCADVDDAMGGLKPRPNGSHFDNGHSFVQQTSEAVMLAKRTLVRLCLQETGHGVFANPAEEIHPMSVAGRILSDVGGPLNTAWWRFACMDGQHREWGQPYFVNHPDHKAVAV
jgi:hypothetical protein